MLLLRSLLFNFFLYSGIVLVFLIALPTLFLPPKFTLIFGKFLGYYVIFIVKIFLSTKVIIKGIENIPKNERYFLQINPKTGETEVWNEELGQDRNP